MEKEPDDWVSRGDPMTGAQASYLKTLSEAWDAPESFETNLTKAEVLLVGRREHRNRTASPLYKRMRQASSRLRREIAQDAIKEAPAYWAGAFSLGRKRPRRASNRSHILTAGEITPIVDWAIPWDDGE
jgi:hypothetical protein